jgi:hypothetical protein
MSNFKRVPVGDGSFCYSGPGCKLHAAEHKEFLVSSLVSDFEGRHANVGNVVSDAICEGSVDDLNSLEDLGVDSHAPGLAVRKCEKHGVYHRYNKDRISGVISRFNSQAKAPFREGLVQAKNDGLLTGPDIPVYSGKISFILGDTSRLAGLDADTQTLKEYQSSLRKSNPELYEASLAKRKGHSESARAAFVEGIQTPGYQGDKPKEKVVVPPKVASENVPPAALLEYWKCGRKSSYSSFGEAESNKTKNDTLSTYKCNYGDHYHLGHGDGKSSDESQLEKAAVHWKYHSELADLFAFQKKLI